MQWHSETKMWKTIHYTTTHLSLQLCVGKSRVLATHNVLEILYLFSVTLTVGNSNVRLQLLCRRFSFQHIKCRRKFLDKKSVVVAYLNHCPSVGEGVGAEAK